MVVRMMHEHVVTTAKKGDPESVMTAMETFCRDKFSENMTIGGDKGDILDDAVN